MSDPLSLRLRTEAALWEEGEEVPPLLLEAAAAIELLAARVAQDEHELQAIRERFDRPRRCPEGAPE